ncbi:MAG: acyl-CoA dehydrogenase family protein [Acidimicrobiia bacterium]|nr:acyl-CoA dehydrogenase family protein [Acidimicrobiia bacterium]
MDVALPGEHHPVRVEVRAFLSEHPDPDPVELAAAGLVAPAWPRPWGRSADTDQILAIDLELAAARVDPIAHNPIGVGWAGPTILAAGTDAQRERYLASLLSGEEIWCQLFSEPGAGSDLASLTTAAVRDGDVYVVDGQKVWNTWADRADFGILLARTDPTAPKHRGISYFICPMGLDGIEVRPIRQMTGESTFCEVFFTDVAIPADCLVGEEGAGWMLARMTLGNERMTLSTGGVLWGNGPTAAEIVDLVRGHGDASLRDRAVRLHIESTVLERLSRRIVTETAAGRDPGLLAAMRKYLADQHGQVAMELAVDSLGVNGMLDVGDTTREYLYARALTIGGGTTQVLADLIAERALGLPR